MVHQFSQFCSCSRAGYTALLERVDLCATTGHSYEFSSCYMPPDCTPSESTLGFCRYGSGYLLYLRPKICYTGQDPILAHFFRQDCWFFPDFSSLTQALSGLHSALSRSSSSLFQNLIHTFQSCILGQKDATESVAFKVYGHICKQAPRRPLSLIFYGPTGVGKSELAKHIAPALRQYTSHDWNTVWTELNTFTEAHSAYRLTGAPPGYVGYDDTPILEAVRRNPYTVFIFDELEKAHPEILKIFMSILDEGRCTARREADDGNRELDFRHCIFVFTSNADLSKPHHPPGFAPPHEEILPTVSTSSAKTLPLHLFQRDEAARQALTRSGVLKEIAGRFSGLIEFQALDTPARLAVTERQMIALGREHGLNIVAVSHELAAALTPDASLSPRSTVGILEGTLTPLFTAHAARNHSAVALRLSGTVDAPVLQPIL